MIQHKVWIICSNKPQVLANRFSYNWPKGLNQICFRERDSSLPFWVAWLSFTLPLPRRKADGRYSHNFQWDPVGLTQTFSSALTQFTLSPFTARWTFYYCIPLLVKSLHWLLMPRLFSLTLMDLHPDPNLPLQKELFFSASHTSSTEPIYFCLAVFLSCFLTQFLLPFYFLSWIH